MYTTQEVKGEIKNYPQVYITQECIGEIKNNHQVYITQECIGEIESNPQVYTNQEGTKNWIHINLYHETAPCLDSFFRLKKEASTFNLYNHYPLLVPECRC